MKRILLLVVLVVVSTLSYGQTVSSRAVLKTAFVTGAVPTQAQFHSWIDSYQHLEEDLILQQMRNMYLYNLANTTSEEDGNIRMGFISSNIAALSSRESGIWYNMIQFPTHPTLVGRWMSINHNSSQVVGITIDNQDTLGLNTFRMGLATQTPSQFTISQSRSGVEISSGTHPLLINGTLWSGGGGGAPGVWTDLGAGSIGYTSANTKVGINTAPTETFHVKGTDNLFATRLALFANNDASGAFEVRNDGSLVLTGLQTNLIFNEQLATGPGGQFQWKRAGQTRVQVGIVDNDLVLSTLAGGSFNGKIRFESGDLEFNDGKFTMRSTVGNVAIFGTNDQFGRVYTNRENGKADIALNKISSTPNVGVIMAMNPVVNTGSNFAPTVDFSAIRIETDSVAPVGNTDVTGITIVQDTAVGLARQVHGINPEKVFPMKLFRGINERGSYLKVVSNEGDVDLVPKVYAGYRLVDASISVPVGQLEISNAGLTELSDPGITGTFSPLPANNIDNTNVIGEKIYYVQSSPQFVRFDRLFEVTLTVSFANTEVTPSLYAIGISKNSGNMLTGGVYASETAGNGDVESVSITGTVSLGKGDYVSPQITCDNAAAQTTDIYNVTMTLKSID